MCGGSILSCCPRNLHGHERVLKEEEELCAIISIRDIYPQNFRSSDENFQLSFIAFICVSNFYNFVLR